MAGSTVNTLFYSQSYTCSTISHPTAYMSSPCHVEMILIEKDEEVRKPDDDTQTKKKVSQKKLKRQKMKAAMSGGVD